VLLWPSTAPTRARFWASWAAGRGPCRHMLATVVLRCLTATLSDASFLSGVGASHLVVAVVCWSVTTSRTKVTMRRSSLRPNKRPSRSRRPSFSVVEVLSATRGGLHRDGSAVRPRTSCTPGGHVLHHYLKVQVGANTSSILWYLLVAHAVHSR